MNNFKIFIKATFLSLFLLAGAGCQKDFLDQVPDDRQTIDDVFKTANDARRYLANVYGYIRSDDDWNNGSPWEGLSDEIDVTYDDYATYAMNVGNWDINRSSYNYWTHYYQGIRAASYYMKRIWEVPDLSEELKTQYAAEARFLRAMYYFMIMRQYGPVIIMPEEPFEPDATLEEMSLPRSSFDECVNYVAAEIDKAIPHLPNVPQSDSDVRNWMRMNKGIALAIKSRMLLYAASPLFNGNTDYADFKNHDGKQLISQQYSEEKWRSAAAAAKAVIDLPYYSLYKEMNGSVIKPYESLKNLFLVDWNSEIIMARSTDLYSTDKNGNPYRLGGWSSWGPTQQAVDAYFMANGRVPITGYLGDGTPVINPESGYSETGFSSTGNQYYDTGTYNMYVGREPRFYVAISFNGSKWINNASNTNGQTGSSPLVLQFYSGGNTGKYQGRNWSRTGYGVRKKVHPSTTLTPDRVAPRNEVLIRLGEIYLNYVEALNEYDPTNPDILIYLNKIRERAGIPQYGSEQLPAPAGKEAMREAIRRERRVELAFETHRYFDTRRWKIAEQTDGGPFYGMNVDATNKENFSRRVVFETRVFQKRYYLWNIMQSELNADRNLVGNPGW